ncbi:MAG: transglutaminase domain-containing protein [Polyangia bacterium]
MARGWLMGLLCAACYGSGVASAEPVLHERIFFSADSARCKDGVCRSQGPRGEEVTAVEQDGHLLQAPSEGPSPVAGEQVFRPEPEVQPHTFGGPPLPGDPPPERRAHVTMDRDTGKDAAVSHTYHEVFTPSVFPYKRLSVLDWAEADGSLAVFSSDKRLVAVLGTQVRRPDYDAFWGSIVVDLEPGRWVPLPTVSADSRILTYRTDPQTAAGALEFAHDAADNFYVRATGTGGGGGQRRLVWLSDAPQAYFGGPIPEARLDEEPRAILPPLPASLRGDAQAVLSAINVHPTPHTQLSAVLSPLVGYFRSFESGELPTSATSTYRDLALSRRGVCRHRAYAFLITAIAAGIPSRYVENELHVFVEVYLPRLGWRRINLGGAALDDEVAGNEERPVHHPRGEDALPRPPQFTASATPPDHAASGSGGGGGRGGEGARVDLRALLEDDARLQSTVEPGAAGKVATHLAVAVSERVAFRGDTIDVSGAVTQQGGTPAASLQIEIYLDSAPGAQRIGRTRSGPDGHFGLAALLPTSLQLGSYTVVARTPGDAQHLPSSSRAR